MMQTQTNQSSLPLIMQFAKTSSVESVDAEYAYNDLTQKPEYRLDWVVPTKTKHSGGWCVDSKTTKTPPKK